MQKPLCGHWESRMRIGLKSFWLDNPVEVTKALGGGTRKKLYRAFGVRRLGRLLTTD
jgi:hypothetical protein